MIKLILFPSIGVLLFCGCSTSDKNIIYNDYPIIYVDSKEAEEVISLSQIVDTSSIQFIKLDTLGGLIGAISKLIITDNELIILDRSPGIIWIYETNGKFRNKIEKKGRGPGEYFSPHTITIKPPDKIAILDVLRSIHLYNTQGEYLYSENTDYYACDIYFDNDNARHIIYRYIPDDARNDHKFFYHIIDNQTGIRKTFFPYYPAGIFKDIWDDFLITNSEKCFIRMPFDNNLYSFQEGTLKVAYAFDFGRTALSHEDIQNEKSSIEFRNFIRDKNYQGDINSVIFTSSHLKFLFYEQLQNNTRNVYQAIYDINTKNLTTFRNVKLDDFNLYYTHPLASDIEFFYSIIYPYTLWPSALSKLGLVGDDPINMNPIIMKYKYH